ncbi:MAG: selenoneine biosynthesis selenosugar synthase SenB [SAR324 cluster bacterium]|nr:selenoneine biosynthesis selenosugar synthase SenB [SAR324 cluster bacterium]MCZ6843980.1 selenoneine biosynthesis selenosugar synthase SenB [SAR324 cluster bacterium]
MKIIMITPAPPRTRHGNRVTALRWRGILEGLGHRVTLAQTYDAQRCDLMIALHARRSHAALRTYRDHYPRAPLVLALTGTDLYRDMQISEEARASLRMATRLVALQPLASRELPRAVRGKLRVIVQSAQAPPAGVKPPHTGFPVCVVGHLREEKDPFRAAMAVRGLPASSRIRVLHAGKALNPQMERKAKREAQTNSRYSWLGELPRWRVRRLLAACRLMVLSSRMEGGANVISEAGAAGLPVLASKIPGTVGLLGDSYPGYFRVGDTGELRELLTRAEDDAAFLRALQRHMARLAPMFQPSREIAGWRNLLAELKL